MIGHSVDSLSSSTPVRNPFPVEVDFLRHHGVSPARLAMAAGMARRQGVTADRVLLAEGIVTERFFYHALASHLGVPFYDGQADVAPQSVMTIVDGYAQLRQPRDGANWIFAPQGAAILRLMNMSRSKADPPIYAVTTPMLLTAAVRRAALPQAGREAAFSAERIDAELSARASLRAGWPLLCATLLLFALLAGVCASVTEIARISALVVGMAFLASIVLRLLACAASFAPALSCARVTNANLPVYTIVIALYRETRIVEQLSRALNRLDYPRAKLDIKFVVETDDEATAQALRAHSPKAPSEIVVAPFGAPRTKPRALNVAMPLAKGSLVAVFDAEDVPEPGQLRRAAELFASLPREVACLQASLVIDNVPENWMTMLFAMDYAALFDVYNRGLASLDLPLFLGGTSNHFRIEPLREIGFWDAWNVTEDADLGLRLVRAGYSVRTFESETWEEAPVDFVALARQRTRWLKGWMQTALAHCRHPFRLQGELGWRRGGAVIAMFVGGVLGPLLGPFFAVRFLHDAIFGDLLRPHNGVETALTLLWCSVAALGAVSLVWPLWLGVRRRNLERHARALLLLPLWLAMLTFAAWRALSELWLRPFHWEKTEHGLAHRETPGRIRQKATV